MTAAVRDFFDDEIAALVRRMADRPTGAGGGSDEDRRDTRAMVWAGLVGLGALEVDDTVALAELLGSVLYQGPLLDTLTARELTGGSTGDDAVVLAVADRTWSRHIDEITTDRDFVGFAAEADQILVGGIDTNGLRLGLVPADDPSVTMRRHEDTGRGEAYSVSLVRTPVTRWVGTHAEWADVLAGARVRQAAYLVGLAQAALDHAVEYARTRRQFGQPIGKAQGPAFRLSELSMRLDATRLLVHEPGAAAHAAANLAAASDLVRTVATQAMQVLGAVGMVSDNDAQLYFRRAVVESVRLGTPPDLRRESETRRAS